MAAYFDKELFTFLKQLKKNNNREWFLRHKTLYEDKVKEPLLDFISDLRPHLLKICANLKVSAKSNGGSLLRIYRDTRFAKDKIPYKTNAGLHFPYIPVNQGIHAPGFYLHLEPNSSFAAAGSWHPDPTSLFKIRTLILEKPKKWEKILKKKIPLEGGSLARAPRGFDPHHPLIDDLKRKDFITSISFTETQVCSSTFLQQYIKACKQMEPLMDFLIEAITTSKKLF
ncbi:MAG: hypothetical protein BGO43_15350 [Gammaproteobacteria bacterium 39-13]|nr:TIGR02453 family protein [Gammaproteobacteria bacterium]OJV87791.1 MAG: hypothetical protein BGO43_15350 [Gammaproteobacteria bacterium 39-13]